MSISIICKRAAAYPRSLFLAIAIDQTDGDCSVGTVSRLAGLANIKARRNNMVITAASVLTTAPRPKLRSIPALYPLPISPALLENKNSNLRVATQLLGLSPALSDAGSSIPSKPYIDVSATTGQVFVALDPATSSGTPRRRSSIGSRMGGRTEWLVVVEFEIPIEKGVENLFRVGINDSASAQWMSRS